MKKILVLVPLMAALAGCPVPERQDTPVPARRLTTPGGASAYWLYVPSYYSRDRQWPLVVTLHGTHGWDSSRSQIKTWKYLAEQRGLIVVAPDLRSVQGILPVNRRLWFRDMDADDKTILSVIDDVSATYRVDPRCVLLTGFSAGGYPLYYTGLKHPERFNMLIARNCNSDIRIFERVKLTARARHMPIVIFWGRDDMPEIQSQSWQAVRWLGERSFDNLRWKKYPGGHLRRPENAYDYWKPLLPKRYRR